MVTAVLVFGIHCICQEFLHLYMLHAGIDSVMKLCPCPQQKKVQCLRMAADLM